MFATADIAAFDMDGNHIWTRNLGLPINHYGHAASLRVWRDLLIVQFDQGTVQEGLSRLLALNTATGKTAWEVKRPVPVSWSTPIIIERQWAGADHHLWRSLGDCLSPF